MGTFTPTPRVAADFTVGLDTAGLAISPLDPNGNCAESDVHPPGSNVDADMAASVLFPDARQALISLAENGMRQPEQFHDLKTLALILGEPRTSVSLPVLAEMYLGVPAEKVRDEETLGFGGHLQYAAKVFKMLYDVAQDAGLLALYELELAMVPLAVDIMVRGILVDCGNVGDIAGMFKDGHDKAEKDLAVLAPGLNVSDREALFAALYGRPTANSNSAWDCRRARSNGSRATPWPKPCSGCAASEKNPAGYCGVLRIQIAFIPTLTRWARSRAE